MTLRTPLQGQGKESKGTGKGKGEGKGTENGNRPPINFGLKCCTEWRDTLAEVNATRPCGYRRCRRQIHLALWLECMLYAVFVLFVFDQFRDKHEKTVRYYDIQRLQRYFCRRQSRTLFSTPCRHTYPSRFSFDCVSPTCDICSCSSRRQLQRMMMRDTSGVYLCTRWTSNGKKLFRDLFIAAMCTFSSPREIGIDLYMFPYFHFL